MASLYVVVHDGLEVLGSSNPPASVSQVVGTIGKYYHTKLVMNVLLQ
jgi:hypothetical protein